MKFSTEEGAASADPPFVSVIIPHFNDLAGLRRCHASLLKQTWPSEHFEIVVADNNSSCGLGAVKQAASSAKVVRAYEQGAGPARNAGVAASRGTVVAFLDSDCQAEPDWLAAGVKSLTHFDFTGGKVVVFAQNERRPSGVEAFEIVFNFDFRRYIEKVGFTGTGNMFVWRRVFDKVGGFRAGVSEDVEWSMRARSAAFRLGYAPDAVVRHPARTSWQELKARWERILTETFALASERPWGRVAYLFRGTLMPLSIFPHAAKIAVSPRLHGWHARLGALATLCRLRFWRTRRMLALVARSACPPGLARRKLPGRPA